MRDKINCPRPGQAGATCEEACVVKEGEGGQKEESLELRVSI